MDRFRDILYLERHLEGSDRASSCAVHLADVGDARLTLLAVAGGPDDAPPAAGGALRMAAWGERWRTRLEALRARATERGVDVRMEVLHGDVATVVEREVRSRGHDLFLTVAGDRETPWPTRLDPVDRALLRRLPCTVWLLDPAQGPGLRVVLAALDVARDDRGELDRRILEIATSLARRTGADLHVVHAWTPVGDSILASPTRGVSRSRLQWVRAQTRQERRERLERVVRSVDPDASPRIWLPRGRPAATVGEAARRVDADVVVVGNVARTGLPALVLGNLPERLVRHVPGSVLSVPCGARMAAPQHRLQGIPPEAIAAAMPGVLS